MPEQERDLIIRKPERGPRNALYTVADQLSEQHHAIVGPALSLDWLRKPSCERHPVADLQLRKSTPAGARQDAMIGRGP
jgi:hypothetical protein